MILLTTINWALIAPILIIEFILKIVALIDWIKSEDTNGPRWLWPILILAVSLFGSVAYFIFGRRQQ